MFKLIKDNKLKFIGLGFLYIFIVKKAKVLWFENDFKDVFPEIFSPTRKRYETNIEDNENIVEAYKKLQKNDDLDIISKRKNKRASEKESNKVNLNAENNFNNLKSNTAYFSK